ncbi:hypothetical protein, partial [Roseateles sp. P5_E11]
MQRAGRQRQGGYVLMLVMASLVLIGFVAARLSQRVDLLRQQAQSVQSYAEGRTQAYSAQALALYWLTTRPFGYAGSGFANEQLLTHDGRLYRTPGGGWVSVQDDRGLLSLNVPNQDLLLPVLTGLGASFEQASRMIAVLEDYVDEDSLRRINGAEAAEYAELGLPPPRNSRLMSVNELARMPVWRD